jgi:hypothetical protein
VRVCTARARTTVIFEEKNASFLKKYSCAGRQESRATLR